MFSYEICEIFKNTYFEEHLRTTAFSSSSFKLNLLDLTVFQDLNLRLVKIKPFTYVCAYMMYIYILTHISTFMQLLVMYATQKNPYHTVRL